MPAVLCSINLSNDLYDLHFCINFFKAEQLYVNG